MIGFLVSGAVIWPTFENESERAETGVTVDWDTIESASVATGVSWFDQGYAYARSTMSYVASFLRPHHCACM